MATSAAKPLKGILKKPTATETEEATESQGTASRSRRIGQRTDEEVAQIARKHALVLQHRKDLEAVIFQSIERLSEFPEAGARVPDGASVPPSPYSAARPAPADVAVFKDLVRIFQPGDYDDLIEERNTYGRCGYCFCAKPRRTFAGGGTWKLVNAGQANFGIVQKRELEKWCSSECARRALYVKVQLSETAAWERVGIPDIQVELLDEGEIKEGREGGSEGGREGGKQEQDQLAQGVAGLRLDDHEQTRRSDEDERQRKLDENERLRLLAVERGDVVATPAKAANARTDAVPPPAPLVHVHIVDKPVVEVPTGPSLSKADEADAGNGTSGNDAHLLLEGYKPKFVG